MSDMNPPEPLPIGTMVKIRNSGFHRARVVEYRGNLGPRGARVYRLMTRRKPHPAYIEVREDQIEVLDALGRPGPLASQADLDAPTPGPQPGRAG